MSPPARAPELLDATARHVHLVLELQQQQQQQPQSASTSALALVQQALGRPDEVRRGEAGGGSGPAVALMPGPALPAPLPANVGEQGSSPPYYLIYHGPQDYLW